MSTENIIALALLIVTIVAAVVSIIDQRKPAQHTKSDILSKHFLNVRELIEERHGIRGITSQSIIEEKKRSITYLKINLNKDTELTSLLDELEKCVNEGVKKHDSKTALSEFDELATKYLNLN